MARGFVHCYGALSSIVPVTLRACFPRGLVAMRLRSLPVRRKYEFYEQPVLFDQAELMAILAHHIAVPGQLPGFVRLFHQMAAIAELGVLLDIVIIPDGEDNPQNRYDEHEGDDDGLIPRAQASFDLFE